MATHITKVEGLARALKDMGEEPTQTAVMAQILNSLPSSIRGFVSAWDSTPEKDQTMANLTARLLKEQELDRKMDNLSVREDRNEALIASGSNHNNSFNRNNQRNNGNNSGHNGNNSSKKSSKAKKKGIKGDCWHCDTPGHREEDCFILHPEKRRT